MAVSEKSVPLYERVQATSVRCREHATGVVSDQDATGLRSACVTAALDTPIALARSAFDLCTPSVNNRCHSAARAPFTTRSLGV